MSGYIAVRILLVATFILIVYGVQAEEPTHANGETIFADMVTMREQQTVIVGGFDMTYFLCTDDTALTLAVKDNQIHLLSFKNINKNWDWITGDVVLPLPHAVSGAAPTWSYQNMSVDTSSGTKLTLRFTSTTPKLELHSIWWARPGGGPVENWMTVLNQSGAPVNYAPDNAATSLQLQANDPVHLHYFEKTAYQRGKVFDEALPANADIRTDSKDIPFIMLDVGATHGAYIGYEWELGGFHVTTGADPRHIAVDAHPITEQVTKEHGALFTMPSVYYGTYTGDIDDGSNQFKKMVLEL